MDQSLSSLYPIHQIGSDGFSWWIGQVESNKKEDPKRSGRYRVRIIGQHLKTGETATQTAELPWAHTMMPVTSPYIEGGTGGASPGLKRGCFVVGFFLDNDKQKPIIMGSLGGVKSSTKVQNLDPGSGPLNFTPIVDPNVIPQQNRSVDTPTGKDKSGANTDKGVIDADKADTKGGAPPILLAAYAKHTDTNPIGGQSCVVIANPNCGQEKNLKSGITRIIGELLAANQAAGGNIGDFYVSKINGLIYDHVATARYHIGRVVRLVKSFIARGKTEIVKQLRGAIDYMNKAILTTEATTGYVAQGPYADPEEAFTPIKERTNRLKKVKEIFDKIFEELGCSIADITDLIAGFITDLIFGYLSDVFNNASCFIDTMIEGILNEIMGQFDALIAKILGPIQAVLDAIAAPLNIIGGVINSIMKLLGISCTGPKSKCEPIQEKCTDCGQNDGQDDLDKLLALIEDGIGDQSLFVCDESKVVPGTPGTNVTFIGGTPKDPQPPGDPSTPPGGIGDDIPPPDDDPIDNPEPPDDDPEDDDSPVPDFPEDPVEDTLLPESDTPFMTVESDKAFYVEGETIVYTITTLNVADDTEFSYTLSGSVDAVDIVDGAMTGTFKVVSNTATIEVGIVKDEIVESKPDLVVFTATGTATLDGADFDLEASTDCIIDNFSEIDLFDPTTDLIKQWQITTDKASYDEGEDVIATVDTINVEDGETATWTLLGTGLTPTDFVGGKMSGTVEITGGKGKIVIGILEDTEVEGIEQALLILNEKGATTSFIINADVVEGDPEDDDDTTTPAPTKPTTGDPITDDGGSIIEIPIKTVGGPYQTPPLVVITGGGYGAAATALLDPSGFVSELRVTRQGVNYKSNTAEENNLQCIIDSYTMLAPGSGYTEPPEVIVGGEKGLAEAIIDERGFVISIRTTDRSKRYVDMPLIVIQGGGGAGARFLPNMVCLDSIELERKGYAKIGTGSYVDCP